MDCQEHAQIMRHVILLLRDIQEKVWPLHTVYKTRMNECIKAIERFIDDFDSMGVTITDAGKQALETDKYSKQVKTPLKSILSDDDI